MKEITMKRGREGGRGCNEEKCCRRRRRKRRRRKNKERKRCTFHGAWVQMGVYPISYSRGLSDGPLFNIKAELLQF